MVQRVMLFWLLVVGIAVADPTPSWAQKALGQACATHQECQSLRCDNRPAAGCVPQDGTGNPGGFCSTHQQCRTGLCVIAGGKYTGVCSGGNRPLGQACATHQECQSLRCDNRPGAGCVAQDGKGEANQFCTTHQQCHSGVCNVAGGKVTGQCTAYNRPLGTPCIGHGECQSLRCDNRPGAGCVPQDGTGATGAFCTTNEQCRVSELLSYCRVVAGIRGECDTQKTYGSTKGPFLGSSTSSQTPATSSDPGGQSQCPSGQVLCGNKCISSGGVCCYQGSANAYSCSSGTHCCSNRCCCSNTGQGMACF
jgi:hypothetical protein